MTSRPSVSVIVCTFNRLQWLPKCLKSLSDQETAPDEIIVVDGPSNDGTREMLELLDKNSEIKLVKQEKLEGISAARNMGLMASNGEIVCFIDDDAIAAKGWLTSILKGYSDDKVGAVGGPVYDMEGNLVMGRNFVSDEGMWYDQAWEPLIPGLFPVMVGCNMSFRKQALIEAGGFDPYYKFHQDETDACLRVHFNGNEIAYLEGASVRHEWCEGSYRKDRLKWYLRLRYLWGRNNSYLVHKYFGDSIPFARYAANRANDFFRARIVDNGSDTQEKEQEPEVSERMPYFFTTMGVFFEICGLLKGWRDSTSPLDPKTRKPI